MPGSSAFDKDLGKQLRRVHLPDGGFDGLVIQKTVEDGHSSEEQFTIRA
ncbi:MAG: hypothetical protein IID46_04970 [Planctomycetes bacterium]|nr:hypothetical protein [Planctomycetota bacterium]